MPFSFVTFLAVYPDYFGSSTKKSKEAEGQKNPNRRSWAEEAEQEELGRRSRTGGVGTEEAEIKSY
jgi:hypothetical protein